MSSFLTPLKVRVLDDGEYYEVLEAFKYYKEDNHNEVIVVPVGFITDFASIPRIFWSIFPPFGKYTKSAVLHDRLCDAFLKHLKWSDVTLDNGYSSIQKSNLIKRKEADKIFLESMKVAKVNKFTRYTLYYAVRLYAIFKYGRNK